MKKISTPLADDVINDLVVGDMILLSGKVYCGRDAVLPKICKLIEKNELPIDLTGSVIFHTAVSIAGVGPTSSNKIEIENSFEPLSRAGVKIHLGKGAIKTETVRILSKYNSIFAVIPPVTALLENNTISKKIVAFPELGIEAFYELEVKDYPCVIAVAHNISIY